MNTIWKYYKLEMTFLERLCASVPASPDLIAAWLEARKPRAIAPGRKTIAEIQEEVFQTITEDQKEEANLLVFQQVDGGLVVRASTIRSHLKECARTISSLYVGKIKGERSFATRFINSVYHDEKAYWIPILKQDGTPFTEPDGKREKPIHVRGPRGEPINALKCFECVDEPKIAVTLKVLGRAVSLNDLETVLSYGGVHGYGGERGDGEGRYVFSIKEINHVG